MSESFDRAEESRERNEGLYYEEYHDRLSALDQEPDEEAEEEEDHDDDEE